MRKWQFFRGSLYFLLVASCRQDDGVHQNIDQTINFYFQDTNGKDLIIPNDPRAMQERLLMLMIFRLITMLRFQVLLQESMLPRKIICSILPELQEEYQKIQLQQVKLIHLGFSSIIVRGRIMILK